MRRPAPKRTVRAGRAQAQRKRLFFAPESIASCPGETGAKAFSTPFGFAPVSDAAPAGDPPPERLSAICLRAPKARPRAILSALGRCQCLASRKAHLRLSPCSLIPPFAPLIQTLNRLLAQSEGPPCADQHKPSFLCPFSTARLARGSLAKSIRPYQKEERIPAGEKAVFARSARTSCYGSRSGFRRAMKALSAGLGLA